MLQTILISIAILALVGLILGAVIAFTAKKFEVESDPRIDDVLAQLPGANCGGCGFAGCSDLAQAIVLKGEDPSKCAAITQEACEAIAKITGKAASEKTEKKVAVVLCSGGNDKAVRNAQYNGILDCRSAQLVANGGGKGCRFGCLGYGTCAHACPFGAIEIRNGLAVVHSELCVGCGKCEQVCPRKLIKLVPASAKVHIYCNSLDKPVQRRKVCSSACLACRKCIKAAGEEHFSSQGFMIRINYANPPDESVVEKAGCPTGCLSREIDRRNENDLKKKETEA